MLQFWSKLDNRISSSDVSLQNPHSLSSPRSSKVVESTKALQDYDRCKKI
jgi:hypothetical protein